MFLTLALNGFQAQAEGLLEPMDAIKQGQLAISDGSSVYVFNKDGSFRSDPIGMSGRIITGTWKNEKGGFRVNGRWGWINGLSHDDERTMLISIGSLSDELQEIRVAFNGGKNGKLNIRKGYFIIQELEKVKASQAPDQKASQATERRRSRTKEFLDGINGSPH
jgi:hypothetical protein